MRDLKIQTMTKLNRLAGKKLLLSFLYVSAPWLAGFAADVPKVTDQYRPPVAEASDEGKNAIARFRLPVGAKMQLMAAEPMLANPVAFSFDEKGRAYVVETFRHHKGVTDIRSHMDWLEDDLASRTVADRVSMYKKHLKDDFPTYNVEQERVRLLEDKNGDGVYDSSSIFAEGFKQPEDGLGAGVLARKGDVYFTCLPKLWLLKDTNGDGKSDIRKPLLDGFGVHVGFLGHDLHGLKIGPDGRLYFSIGDRGINVKTPEGKHLNLPDTGSVIRCELDGSNMEIFAYGLRNPQELAFDEFGNLFTHDNNSDSGDKARVTYLTEGADHGWRIGYQFFNDRGPWNNEKMWHPPFEGQAAYIVPPIDNLGNGPSGLTYNPGLGLGGRDKGKFFVADFKGSNALSGVRTFTVEPKGAGYRMSSTEDYIWGMCVTDVDFAPDGGLVMSDWVDGWAQPGKGRLYKMTFPEMANRDDLKETAKLIGEDLSKRSVTDLVPLINHPDMRVRQEAQFALVGKGKDGREALISAAHGGPSLIARLHGIWGVGMIARKDPSAIAPLRGLLKEGNAEIRAQVAETLGDLRDQNGVVAVDLIALLKDESARVRFLAAQALGQIGVKSAAMALRNAVAEANDKDPWLRHSYALALSRINDESVLAGMLADPSPALRKTAVVALRRTGAASVAKLLNDPDLFIALEAARAINDQPINEAMPALAALNLEQAMRDPALMRRVIAANTRVGGPDSAKRLVAIACNEKAPEEFRSRALTELARWDQPQARDAVIGVWRPLEARKPEVARKAIEGSISSLIGDKNQDVQKAAAVAAGLLKIQDAAEALQKMAANGALSGSSRTEALKALNAMQAKQLPAVVELAVNDRDAEFRAEGRRMLASLEPKRAVELIQDVLKSATIREQQSAFSTLGQMQDAGSDAVLTQWLGKLTKKSVAPELQLDLLAAAEVRAKALPEGELAKILKTYKATKSESDLLANYVECLEGGRADQGQIIVANNAAAACMRCHIIRDKGGNVGPELNGIGKKYDRQALLESIVTPNAKIADGFQSVVLALKDGTLVAGVLRKETADEIIVVTADTKIIAVPTKEIEERAKGISAMPGDLIQKLSRQEIRDVVEYLSTLK